MRAVLSQGVGRRLSLSICLRLGPGRGVEARAGGSTPVSGSGGGGQADVVERARAI